MAMAARQSPSDAPIDYVERVNCAIDYILQHLDQRIVLDDVARVALFSPFHFHRIFRSVAGETLRQFVRRVRLERALHLMAHDSTLSLTDIALRTGFSSSSDFSRTFRQRYGVPPSVFDIDVYREQSRDRLNDMMAAADAGYRLERLPPGENPDNFEASLRELPARSVAYIRVQRPFEEGNVVGAAQRLVAWAESHGKADGTWLGYMWDDPDVVALEDCRYDVGVVVDSAKREGEVGIIEFPSMLVAEVEMRGDIALEQRLIDWLWGTWLPRSPYVPTDQPSFECWLGRPFEHGIEHFELRIQIPVGRTSP